MKGEAEESHISSACVTRRRFFRVLRPISRTTQKYQFSLVLQ